MSPQTLRRQEPLLTAASFRDARTRLVDRHRSGGSGLAVVSALSDLYDRTVSDVFRSVPQAAVSPLTVVALGGYGRREMCFSSDCDLMILAPDAAAQDDSTHVMQQFFHRLLDAGLDVGHSYRTVDDLWTVRGSGLDVWLSLLDARLVCGSSVTYRSFLGTVRRIVKRSAPGEFVGELLALHDARHQKYGRSTKLLEPNIKNSAGGLRDLHTVVWLLRGTGLEPVGGRRRRGTMEAILGSRTLRDLFPPRFPARALRAFDMLLRTRNEMHLFAGSLHDSLEFATQSQIAAALGVRAGGSRTPVDRFMRDHFDDANVVAELSARVVLWARDRWLHAPGTSISRTLNPSLRLRAGKVELAHPTGRLTARTVLEAFHAKLEYGAEFSFQLEDAVHRRLTTFRSLRSADETALFTSIFERRSGVAATLQLMNRLGLLERWIPEWRPLVRFFQHNQYHYYTADEHTLRVVENAESLSAQATPFGEAYRALPRADVLLYACLLHDIAKPQRVEDHEIAGVRVARRVLTRLHRTEVADDVSFLVRHHLDMEQVAFRRNLADPATIQEFAKRFPRAELLDLLYCLTYADLSAVNKNVWTEWKASLLTDLYLRTRRFLRHEPQPASTGAMSLPDRLVRQFAPDALEPHRLLLQDAGYRTAFSLDEIVDHLRLLTDVRSVHVLTQQWSDVTEVTILAPDAPFVLSKCCGVLTANDANIIDANIFTRDDGIVIDKFRVVDSVTHAALPADRCRKIDQDLQEVMAGRIDPAHLIERHRRRWKRTSMRHNPNVRIDVEFEDHPRFTIIDVYGADTLGFLYRVTETMSTLGLSIHFAKIATRGDGIVDSFYVLDRSGSRLDDPARRDEVYRTLRTAVRELADSELVAAQPL